jgi:hypothetical protein
MYYVKLPKIEGESQIYARIDDDGLCRVTCIETNSDFAAWVALGNTPKDTIEDVNQE